MAPLRSVPFLATAALLIGSCDGTVVQNAPPKPFPDTGAGAGADAASSLDTGPNAATDTGARDTGGLTIEDTGGGGGGPLCMELADCCPTLPAQAQGACDMAVANGDEGGCQQSLGFARMAGRCLPPDHDAGPPRDAGPLGPACMTYLACCPELGPLQGTCENTANGGDEMRCQTSLDLARRINRCLPPDAGVLDTGVDLDAGTSTTADGGSVGDAGTSTTGMDLDAGTSTVADGG